MSAPETPADDRHSRMLAELASMSLTLARDLQQRALAAETTDEAAKLATAFHRVSRGLRQTLALELKVIRYRDQEAREAAEAVIAADAIREKDRAEALGPGGALWTRRDAIAGDVERLIYTEHEGEDWTDEVAMRRQRRLNDWLDELLARPDVLAGDLDDQVVEACREVGVDPGRIFTFGDDDAPAPAVSAAAAHSETAPPRMGATPSPEDSS